MTNEEKVKKIADSVFSSGFNTNRTFYDMAVNTAVAIAEWKDSQPQIIEIFGKRVKIVEDETNTIAVCCDCVFNALCKYKLGRGSLCETAGHNLNRHFVEVDEDGNEIKGGE